MTHCVFGCVVHNNPGIDSVCWCMHHGVPKSWALLSAWCAKVLGFTVFLGVHDGFTAFFRRMMHENHGTYRAHLLQTLNRVGNSFFFFARVVRIQFFFCARGLGSGRQAGRQQSVCKICAKQFWGTDCWRSLKNLS